MSIKLFFLSTDKKEVSGLAGLFGSSGPKPTIPSIALIFFADYIPTKLNEEKHYVVSYNIIH